MSDLSSIDTLMSGRTIDPNIINTYRYQSINKENIYTFMDNSYYGSGGYRNGNYLIPHSREMFYPSRQDACFYKNYVKPILRAMVEPVFTKPAPRRIEGAAPLFEKFVWDCDNTGTYLQNFTELVVTTSRLHGISFVVMDNYATEKIPATVDEASEKRIFPYVYLRKANEVRGYELDGYGKLLKIQFNEKPEKNSKGDKLEKYREWTDVYSRVYMKDNSKDDTFRLISETMHGLGIIPVIAVYSAMTKDRNCLLVDPPLYDIARINHTLFNKDSEIREIERNQGFSIFYLQAEPGNITIGKTNALFIPQGSTIIPGFASPDPNIQKVLMENSDKLLESLFKIAEQSGVTGVQAPRSGIAIQWDFFAQESVLVKTSSIATTLEEKISELFKLYTKETFTYTVDYPDKFQPNDKLAEIQVYQSYLDMGLPPKLEAYIKIRILRLLFSDEDDKIIKEMEKEIEQEFLDGLNSKIQETENKKLDEEKGAILKDYNLSNIMRADAIDNLMDIGIPEEEAIKLTSKA